MPPRNEHLSAHTARARASVVGDTADVVKRALFVFVNFYCIVGIAVAVIIVENKAEAVGKSKRERRHFRLVVVHGRTVDARAVLRVKAASESARNRAVLVFVQIITDGQVDIRVKKFPVRYHKRIMRNHDLVSVRFWGN